eukprot:1133809-Prymnesium_polylepis.1
MGTHRSDSTPLVSFRPTPEAAEWAQAAVGANETPRDDAKLAEPGSDGGSWYPTPRHETRFVVGDVRGLAT